MSAFVEKLEPASAGRVSRCLTLLLLTASALAKADQVPAVPALPMAPASPVAPASVVTPPVATPPPAVAAPPPSAEAPPTPNAIVVEVGTVRVTTMRPGTDRAWNTVQDAKKAPGLCDVGKQASGMVGAGLLGACAIGILGDGDEPMKVDGRDLRMPNAFVQIRTGGRTPTFYRTRTVPNIFEYDFRSRFVVPFDAIGPSGLQLQVVNDDGSSHPNDLIGSALFGRKRLLEIIKEAEPITIKDGGIDKLVVTITSDTPTTEERTVNLTVGDGLLRVPGLRIDAGQVVEVCATGVYKLNNGFWVPPFGIAGKVPALEERRYPNFDGNFAAALAVVGTPDSAPVFAVGPCGIMVADRSGPLHVGINDQLAAQNTGVLRFHIRVTDPTTEEWRARETRRQPSSLLARLPVGKLKVSATPAGAEIFVDGIASVGGVLKVVAGQHTIWARWPDGKGAVRMQDVFAGSETPVIISPPEDAQ